MDPVPRRSAVHHSRPPDHQSSSSAACVAMIFRVCGDRPCSPSVRCDLRGTSRRSRGGGPQRRCWHWGSDLRALCRPVFERDVPFSLALLRPVVAPIAVIARCTRSAHLRVALEQIFCRRRCSRLAQLIPSMLRDAVRYREPAVSHAGRSRSSDGPTVAAEAVAPNQRAQRATTVAKLRITVVSNHTDTSGASCSNSFQDT